MSEAVFVARPPSSLAWLKPRLVSLFGSEDAAAPIYDAARKRQDGSALDGLAKGRTVASLGRRFVAPLKMAVAGTSLLVVAVTLIGTAVRNLPAAAPEAPAPPFVAWRDIIKPVRIYNLEAPEFAGAPLTYTARRHEIGGGREDVLALGTLNGEKPAIRFRIFRRAAEAPSKAPLFAALVHEAAQIGLAIGRSGLPDLVATRFGRVEVADISLARKDSDEVACSGFRLNLDKPSLSLSGLACGRHAMPLTHLALGCLIERLDVASARDDRDLIDFFARSELHRNAACSGMRLGPDGLHAPWLDDKPAEAKLSESPVSSGFPKRSRLAANDDKPVTSRKRLRRR